MKLRWCEHTYGRNNQHHFRLCIASASPSDCHEDIVVWIYHERLSNVGNSCATNQGITEVDSINQSINLLFYALREFGWNHIHLSWFSINTEHSNDTIRLIKETIRRSPQRGPEAGRLDVVDHGSGRCGGSCYSTPTEKEWMKESSDDTQRLLCVINIYYHLNNHLSTLKVQ